MKPITSAVRFAGYAILAAVAVFALSSSVQAESRKEKQKRQLDELAEESKEAQELFCKADADLKKRFSESAGYALFPKIAKGAAGVGAAHGSGLVFENGKTVGQAKVTQVTVGFQLGGQVYSEVIFFETASALKSFQKGDFKFSAQVSAVAAAEGASRNAKYELGVMVFTMARSGLMYEASVGGQKFSYRPLDDDQKK